MVTHEPVKYKYFEIATQKYYSAILIIMKVNIKIQQLKAAREGTTELNVSDVFDEEEVDCLEHIKKSKWSDRETTKSI